MSRTTRVVLMALFTALIAVGAFLKIPLPVAPFTLQFLFTTMAGLLLGGKYGAACVLCYLCLGLMGLPVFAGGGGPGYVLEPTFGYLIGFCAGAWVTGRVAHGGARGFPPALGRLLGANFLGLLVVYAFGMTYCWLISAFWLKQSLSLWTLFLYGFVLAVPGDAALCVLAAALARRLLPVLQRKGWSA